MHKRRRTCCSTCRRGKQETKHFTDAMLVIFRLVQIKAGVAIVIFSLVEIQGKVAVVIVR